MKKSMIGGQAVLEGVMMKAPKKIAIAVRKTDGTIELKTKDVTPLKDKYKILGWPILRGIVAFIETLIIGIKALLDSAKMFDEEAEETEPSKFEKFVSKKTGKNIEDIVIFFAMLTSLGFAILLFVVLPVFLTNFLKTIIENTVLLSIVEGLIRLSIFFIYIFAITFLNDIKRFFEYHGAEHKTINCFESDEELCVENARKHTTLHPRCGTAFLLIVMVISIFAFSLLGWENIFLRMLFKLLLFPIVAGISYEIIKWAGRSDSKIVKIVIYPGLMLQKLTTREPDDEQLEVAIESFKAAAGEMAE